MGSLEPELGPPLIRDPRSFEGLYHEILNEPEEAQVLAGRIEWLDAHGASLADNSDGGRDGTLHIPGMPGTGIRIDENMLGKHGERFFEISRKRKNRSRIDFGQGHVLPWEWRGQHGSPIVAFL